MYFPTKLTNILRNWIHPSPEALPQPRAKRESAFIKWLIFQRQVKADSDVSKSCGVIWSIMWLNYLLALEYAMRRVYSRYSDRISRIVTTTITTIIISIIIDSDGNRSTTGPASAAVASHRQYWFYVMCLSFCGCVRFVCSGNNILPISSMIWLSKSAVWKDETDHTG